MNNFIFNPKSLFSSAKKIDNTDEKLYTLTGYEDTKDNNGYATISKSDSDKIFAKQTLRKDGTTKYLVRLSNNGKLFNPLSIYGIEQDNSFLNRVCRSNKKFREVNEKTFSWYIKFLNTKNIAWLNNAEREME